MKLRIQKLETVDETIARKMFEWEADPKNIFYCGPSQGPDEPPRFKSWQHRQASLNRSSAYRFGIFDEAEFVGEFNFVFGHSALLKNEPRSVWIGIGIGDPRYRGKGIGTLAMNTIEQEVKALGGLRVELGVLGFNEPAIRFYEKLGYRRFAEIPHFTWHADRWWSDFRYEKLLF